MKRKNFSYSGMAGRMGSADAISPARAVVLVAGAVLLLAAGLKAWRVIHSPVAMPAPLGITGFTPVLIGWEIFLGLWLLSGALPLAARRTAIGCFAFFGGYACWEALAGKASCGCFGQVHVNPWFTVLLDAAMVAMLIGSSRRGRQALRRDQAATNGTVKVPATDRPAVAARTGNSVTYVRMGWAALHWICCESRSTNMNRYFGILTVTALLMPSIPGSRAAKTIQPPLPTAHEVAAMLAATRNAVHSISARFTYTYGVGNGWYGVSDPYTAEVHLQWDIPHNLVRASLVGPDRVGPGKIPNPNRPSVNVWVRNDKKEWFAQADYVSGRPNAWNVTLTRPGYWLGIPDVGYLSIFGLQSLKKAMIAFSAWKLKVRVGPFVPGTPWAALFKFKSITPEPGHTYVVVYKSRKSLPYPLYSFRLVYMIRLRKGLEILRTQVFVQFGGENKLVFDLIERHFSSDGHGHYFPRLITKREWQFSPYKLKSMYVMRFHRVRINPRLPSKTFVYVPNYGSFIEDSRHVPPHDYFYGYKNPNVPLGHNTPAAAR